MSAFSYRYEERLCRICHGYDVEYRDGHYVLHQTSTRTYAHPHCMVEKHGLKAALEKVKHAWQKREFKKALKHPIKKGGKHPLEAALRGLMS